MKKSIKFTGPNGGKIIINPSNDFILKYWGIGDFSLRLTNRGKVILYNRKGKIVTVYPSSKKFLRTIKQNKFFTVLMTKGDIVSGDEYWDILIMDKQSNID